MSQLCPQGHASEMTDFCSECGLAMRATAASAPAAAAPAPAGAARAGGSRRCSNCDEPHGVDDVFCENCGFDFSSGSLPDADTEPTTASTAGATAGSPAGSSEAPVPASVTVSVDLDYFATVVEGGEVTLPDPLPQPTTLALPAGKALIGRHSASRGIFPEIDVEKLTGDPAVSSRHAMLHRSEDGTWQINDLGSTNGTRVGDPNSDEIVAGDAHMLAVGVPVFVGAWTRIELQ